MTERKARAKETAGLSTTLRSGRDDRVVVSMKRATARTGDSRFLALLGMESEERQVQVQRLAGLAVCFPTLATMRPSRRWGTRVVVVGWKNTEILRLLRMRVCKVVGDD